jgi:hypothetical protein
MQVLSEIPALALMNVSLVYVSYFFDSYILFVFPLPPHTTIGR